MALTRKLLKGMGLTDEQVETIIEAHTETTDALKLERDGFKESASKLSKVQKELDDLKAQSNDGFEEKYNKVKREFDQYKADQTAKETRSAKESAVRALLKDAGISEKRLESVLKVYDVDGVELDGNGALKDADKLTDAVKTEWADFIVTTTTQGAQTANPPANNGGANLTKEDIYKKDDKGRYVMSTAERQKALMENKIT